MLPLLFHLLDHKLQQQQPPTHTPILIILYFSIWTPQFPSSLAPINQLIWFDLFWFCFCFLFFSFFFLSKNNQKGERRREGGGAVWWVGGCVGFYSKKRAYKRVQTITILHHVVVATGEASSRLGVLSSFSPISLHYLLQFFTHLLGGHASCYWW